MIERDVSRVGARCGLLHVGAGSIVLRCWLPFSALPTFLPCGCCHLPLGKEPACTVRALQCSLIFDVSGARGCQNDRERKKERRPNIRALQTVLFAVTLRGRSSRFVAHPAHVSVHCKPILRWKRSCSLPSIGHSQSLDIPAQRSRMHLEPLQKHAMTEHLSVLFCNDCFEPTIQCTCIAQVSKWILPLLCSDEPIFWFSC